METLFRDLRFAFRTLRRSSGFTAVAVLTLALGIGATTAIFSFVNGVLLNPLPFPDADRLAMVWMDNQRLGIREDITSYPNYLEWRGASESFSDLAAFRRLRLNLTGEGEPERIAAAAVTANFFDILGVQPVEGRAFAVEEEQPGRDRVVVLSHGLWQRRFAGDPDVVGRAVRLNGDYHLVVGIMPAGFAFPSDAELWQPLAPPDGLRNARGAFWLYTVGRLRPGADFERAQAEMSGVAARLAEEFPNLEGYGIFVHPMRDHFVGDVRPALLVLLGAVAFVLLIACANVANLLLARGAGREREVAIRAALGAGRLRLVRQLLTESVVLAGAGGVLGLAVAVWGVAFLKGVSPAELPRLAEVGVDGPVLAFALGVSLLTGIAFGLAPALQVSRPQLTQPLKSGGHGLAGGRHGRRTRTTLVVAEVALALVLLVGAGLLLQSFDRLRSVDPGFQPSGVLTAHVALSGAEYAEPEAVAGFYTALLARVRVLPGVESAAAASDILLPELARSSTFTVEGRPDPPPSERIEVPIDAVTPGFFRTLGTPLLRGRDFLESDDADAPPVAIINDAMARRFWPGEDALGGRFKYGDADSDGPWLTVVGVVGDARRTALEREARPSTFLPHRQAPIAAMRLVVRTAGNPAVLAGAVRREVVAIDPDQPVAEVATLEALLGERLAQRRLTALLVGLFSALALVLAVVGVYGLISYSVNQSTREIGLRMALGAQGGDVLRLVIRQVMILVLVGAAVGFAAALVLTRTLSGLLYGIAATDPLTFAGVIILLIGVAAAAGYLPARRAARLDPMIALRQE